MINLIITGCFGRMGKELIKILQSAKFDEIKLIAGICKDEQINQNSLFNISSNLKQYIDQADVILDFTTPKASLNFATICAANNTAFITGTTGFNNIQYQQFTELAKKIPIFMSANMSIGINILCKLASKIDTLLESQYDCEILEMHHNQKADAPSGTALMLGASVASARKMQLKDIMVIDRNKKRKSNEIGFASLRGGSVVGDHSIIFAGQNESITISHHAINRSIFASGALCVAKWFKNKPVGKIYTMEDYLA
jgi:4-hydroxy-tetrahydrodipicolinate reductase